MSLLKRSLPNVQIGGSQFLRIHLLAQKNMPPILKGKQNYSPASTCIDAEPTGQDNYGQETKTRGRAMAEHGRPRCCLDHSLINDSSRLIRSFMGLLLLLVALFHVDGAFVVLPTSLNVRADPPSV